MRILRRMRNDAIMLVALCAVGYVAYQILLDEEAKESVNSLVRTVSYSYGQLTSMVNEHIGTIMDEDVVIQNRQDIRNAWKDLGY